MAELLGKRFESEADVIIIGTGFAGLAAAIEAAEAGSSVLVLEKMLAPGGNSIISDGGIAAPGTQCQLSVGISDSPELMARDMMIAGEGINYPELVRVITEGAKDAFLWSRDYLDVKYKQRVDIFGGHSVARCYTPDSISGADLIQKQLIRLSELKVKIRLGAYVKSLIQDDSGRVCGVRIIDGYRYKNLKAGEEKDLFVTKAVIVASGGFGGDVEFRRAQDPRLGSSIMTTNKPFATAEVLKECLRVGANPVHLSRIQLGPWASPDESGFGAGPLFCDYVVLPYGILIDPETGTRFVNELSDRRKLAEAMLKLNHPVIGIADATAVDIAGWDLSRALRKQVVRRFNSLEDLTQNYQIDGLKLTATVARFAELVSGGQDVDYCKPILKEAQPMRKPPFYSMRVWPKVHHTMGGVQIDTEARVIHRDQYPIGGLFAAGEVTGGIHGACRLGSCAITECLVMGRIAGRNASALKKTAPQMGSRFKPG